MRLHELSPDSLPAPETIRRDAIIIFDDCLTENQKEIATFFMRGRHCNLSCFYLAQSYTKIPKKMGIRENFNFLILFKQDIVNLRQIHAEHITDLTFQQFKNLCNHCWSSDSRAFLTVDLEDGRNYRFKFEKCLKI